MLEALRLSHAPGVAAQLIPAVCLLFAGDIVEELLIDQFDAIEDDRAEEIALRQRVELPILVEHVPEKLEFRIVEGCDLFRQDALRRGDTNTLTDH